MLGRSRCAFNPLGGKTINAKDLLNEYLGKRLLAFPPSVLSAAWVRSMAGCECRLIVTNMLFLAEPRYVWLIVEERAKEAGKHIT